jgi:16S rRNA processing protein RimM
MEDEAQDLVYIGEITKPHGVKGQVNAFLKLPGLLVLADLIDRELKVEGLLKEVFVESASHKDKLAILKFKGYNTLQATDELRQKKLFLKRSQIGNLPKNEFYIKDLIGSQVADWKSKEPVGKVIEVDNIPGNPLLKIEMIGGGGFLLPMIEEYVFEIRPEVVLVKDWELFC